MKIKCLTAAAFAIAAVGVAGPALAQQQQQEGLYAYHTGAIGGCPALDWHLNLAPGGKLTGFVAWGDHLAKLAGTLKPDRSFEMAAQEVGGQGRKATVKGTGVGQYITAYILGSGTACDNQPIQIPRMSGGMAGGGG